MFSIEERGPACDVCRQMWLYLWPRWTPFFERLAGDEEARWEFEAYLEGRRTRERLEREFHLIEQSLPTAQLVEEIWEEDFRARLEGAS
jgi:hypothetical protein